MLQFSKTKPTFEQMLQHFTESNQNPFSVISFVYVVKPVISNDVQCK